LRRERHPLPCHDRIEFTRDQHGEIAEMMNRASNLTCLISGAPKDISTRRTDDR
jgi:hypothetical protein